MRLAFVTVSIFALIAVAAAAPSPAFARTDEHGNGRPGWHKTPQHGFDDERDHERRGRDRGREWEKNHDDHKVRFLHYGAPHHHHGHRDVLYVFRQNPYDHARFHNDDLSIVVSWRNHNRFNAYALSDLPPWLTFRVRERCGLPPGLPIKAVPVVLSDRLGPTPYGYTYAVIGHDLALIHVSSGAIADVMQNIL